MVTFNKYMRTILSRRFYAERLYQQDGHNVIDIIFLLFSLDKGHVPEKFW